MQEWHVWSIIQAHYKNIENFLTSLPEIEEFLYPKIIKEYETKFGRKTKNIPLYSTYIFVKYDHTPTTMAKLMSCEWLKGYIGTCNEQEIAAVNEVSKKKYEDLIPTKEVKVGHRYKLIGTPFKGTTCLVNDISNDRITVSVEIFGSEKFIKCAYEDLDLER
jgi:transcription antitermination factor NusG